MKKAGGHRNFGYGKQMEWAGKQALRDRYGNGHYGTVAGHAERWRQFVAWCRDERDIRDARKVDAVRSCRTTEGHSGTRSMPGCPRPTHRTCCRSVNVVLEAMRERSADSGCASEPSSANGHEYEPTHRRVSIKGPCASVRINYARMDTSGLRRLVEVARALGLRLKEASLLNARVALGQVKKHGAVNITAGTKGGRGHRVDRWVPVSGMGDRLPGASGQGPGTRS